MLQFMDCSNCGKRVRTTAVQCHHCQQVLVSSAERNPGVPGQRGKRARDADSDFRGSANNPGNKVDNELGDNVGNGDGDGDSDSAQSHYALNGGYDTSDDDFDYEEYLAEEFPDQPLARPSTVKPWVWITAWLLIAAILLPFFFYFINL